MLSARSILIVGAHPDDPDAFAAGTVARWTAAGARVRYVVVTSGDKGVPNDEINDPTRFITMREEEQRRSAAALGAEEVIFLRHRDGEVMDSLELRGQIVREIRRAKADIVVTHDPLTRMFRQHPDHRAVGFATLAAAFPSCRLASFYPEQIAEGLEPHSVHMLLLGGATRTDRTCPSTSARRSNRRSRPSASTRARHPPSSAAFAPGWNFALARLASRSVSRSVESFTYAWPD